MTVAYLAVGDEILRGETREGNGHALAVRLRRRGLKVGGWRVVADDRQTVVRAAHEMAREHRLLLVSGGLGPTDDDGTRQAIADAAGSPLALDDALAERLARRYRVRGRVFGAANKRQAWIPQGADILVNDGGTAPGFVVAVHGCLVACLPGVPREFAAMADAHLDRLLAAAEVPVIARAERTMRVFGITESDLQSRLASLPGYEQMHVRSLPHFPEIRLALSSRANDEELDAYVASARAALGWRVFSVDPTEPYAAAVVRTLQQIDATVAVAESCTGGLIGDLLTDVAGVSETLKADLVCYANTAKESLLGVPAEVLTRDGAVSEATARAMAEGARRVAGADYGLATTGVAGPSGGTADKPVGTIWIALAGPGGTSAWHTNFGHLDRWRFKRLVAFTALARLRTAALSRI